MYYTYCTEDTNIYDLLHILYLLHVIWLHEVMRMPELLCLAKVPACWQYAVLWSPWSCSDFLPVSSSTAIILCKPMTLCSATGLPAKNTLRKPLILSSFWLLHQIWQCKPRIVGCGTGHAKDALKFDRRLFNSYFNFRKLWILCCPRGPAKWRWTEKLILRMAWKPSFSKEHFCLLLGSAVGHFLTKNALRYSFSLPVTSGRIDKLVAYLEKAYYGVPNPCQQGSLRPSLL